MGISTRLTAAYGIRHPLVSAGMAFVGHEELAAAVSNAGGLGVLGASPDPVPSLRVMAERMRRLTDRPWGVDLIHADTGFGPASTIEHVDACAPGVPGAGHLFAVEADAKPPAEPADGAPIGHTTLFPHSAKVPYDLPRYSTLPPSVDTTGDWDLMVYPAGTGVGAITAIEPAAAIVDELMARAEHLLAS